MRLVLLPLLLAAPLLTPPALDAQTNPKILGSPAAPVTMEVFSDFECPHCKHLHDDTLKAAIADCIAKGKVQLVRRDYPLSQHKYAREAARYAIAAGRIGHYELICDQLFATQEEWGTGGKNPGDVDAVVARVLSPADMAKVRKLVKDPQVDAEVSHDMELGAKVQLNQTPTIVLKSKGKTYPIAGYVSYDILKRLIETF
jgi:protein-disulfide isomerase